MAAVDPPTHTWKHLPLQDWADRNLLGPNYNVESEAHPINIQRFYGRPLKREAAQPASETQTAHKAQSGTKCATSFTIENTFPVL